MYWLGIFIAFISPFSHAVSNIFDSYVVGDIFKKLPTTIFYMSLTNFIGLIFLFCFGSITFLPTQAYPFLFIVAAINVLYLFPYFAALRVSDTSVVAALFSLEKVFVPFFAYYFLREILCVSQYIGLFLIVLASMFLNLKNARSLKFDKGFYLMLLTAFLLSFEGILYKKLLTYADWINVSFWCSLCSLLLCFTFLMFKPTRKDILKNKDVYQKNFSKFFVMELFDQIGYFAPICALSFIPVVVETGISATQPLFVALDIFILNQIFHCHFNENLQFRNIVKKIICYLLIIFGTYLIVGA